MERQILEDQLELARQGIEGFLSEAKIDDEARQRTSRTVLKNLREWLINEDIARISRELQPAILDAISNGSGEKIVNTFRQDVKFGTGGIRGMMAFDKNSIEDLAKDGFDARILKGPNTINEIVLLRVSAGVAQYGKDQNPPLTRVVIGYDSRIRGKNFAEIVAQLFLSYGYTVYFFDEACPYPEMTFAIPCAKIEGDENKGDHIRGDIGILISASHNDYRYNGYKLSCSNGSQFDPTQRDKMYDKYIAKATFGDIQLTSFADVPFDDAASDKLWFLGGSEPLPDFDYHGREGRILDIHKAHCDHVKKFLLSPDLAQRQRDAVDPLRIAYCAFHGAGRRAVPRLLREVGFSDVRIIKGPDKEKRLDLLNGMFPCFESAAGREQQPDPGDDRAARIAVDAFKAQGDLGSFDDIDILIGTDPDADRCGVVVKVPEVQRELYKGKDWTLLPADGMWALLLWYRLQREIEQHGEVRDASKKFIVLSHTTSDASSLLARNHGLGVIKTWVGFAALAASVRDIWDGKGLDALTEGVKSIDDQEQAGDDESALGEGKSIKKKKKKSEIQLCHPFVCEYYDMEQGARSINVAAMEQSNGFSILGGPPPEPKERSLGKDGHVRDKDGTLAALLVAEIAAWAKERGTSIFELIDEKIWLDPEIGLFVNGYEPDPLDGEYPGIKGDQTKKEVLRRVLGYCQFALAGEMTLAGRQVIGAVIYRCGKYDSKDNRPTLDFQFPDEGVRFYLETEEDHPERKLNHVTVRPSGTGNSLRFHVQLHDPDPGPDTESLLRSKRLLMTQRDDILNELREILKAPRPEDA